MTDSPVAPHGFNPSRLRHLAGCRLAQAGLPLDASRTMEHDALRHLSEGERAMRLELRPQVARRP